VAVDAQHSSSMFVCIGLAILTIVVIKFFQKRKEPATFGIYQKPGKWYFLKLSFVFLLLKARKVMFHIKNVIFILPVHDFVSIEESGIHMTVKRRKHVHFLLL
jgi:hypothetical protein